QHQRHVDQMRRRSGVTPVHSQPEPLTVAIAPLDSTPSVSGSAAELPEAFVSPVSPAQEQVTVQLPGPATLPNAIPLPEVSVRPKRKCGPRDGSPKIDCLILVGRDVMYRRHIRVCCWSRGFPKNATLVLGTKPSTCSV